MTDEQTLMFLKDLSARITTLEDERKAKHGPSMLQDLLQSSSALVTRFGGTLTANGTLAKFAEETFEFGDAAIDMIDNQTRPPALLPHDAMYSPASYRLNVARECIDVIVTMGGVLAYLGITWDEIEAAAQHVIAKNEAKGTQDYAWDEVSKTVKKKSKMGVKP